MFTRSAPLIANNLWQGGLSQPQATAVTAALGQCNAPLTHRAPVEIDYTSPNMQLINPTFATYQYPTINMAPPETSPPKPNLPGFPNPPEEELPYQPQPFDPPPPVYNTNNYYNYYPIGGGSGSGSGSVYLPKWLFDWFKQASEWFEELFDRVWEAGDFLDIDDSQDTFRYYLKTETNDSGNVCTFGADEIIGKPFADLVNEGDNAQTIRDALLDSNPNPGNNVTVLTGVTLTANGLEFSTETVSVLDASPPGSVTIPVEDCP